MKKMLRQVLVVGSFLLAGLTASAARAEVVQYSFTGTTTSTGSGISSTVSGSFTYNSGAGWYGGSNAGADSSMQLTINEYAEVPTSLGLWVEYNGKTFTMQETAQLGNQGFNALLLLSGQSSVGSATPGTLPTSLSVGNGGSGTLTLSMSSGTVVYNLSTLSSGSSGGSTSTPELDPNAGAGALALVLGGVGMVVGRRRRRG